MHELDQTNGVTSFVTARVPAWHRLGTVFPTELTVAEALEQAHLARWNVRLLELFGREDVVDITEDGVNSYVREVVSSAHRLVVRDNPVTGQVEPFGPIGLPYVSHDWASGTVDAIVEALAEAPDIAFTAWYGLMDEYLGDFYRFAPGLGMYRAACTEEGEPVFTGEQVEKAIRFEPYPKGVRDLLGSAWQQAIEGMPTGATVTPPPLYNLEWDRKTGEIDIDGRGGRYSVGYDGPTAASATAPVSPGAAEEKVAQFLAARGWIIAAEWTSAFRGRLWTTQVYRADDCEVSA